jgi:hypothetical protein
MMEEDDDDDGKSFPIFESANSKQILANAYLRSKWLNRKRFDKSRTRWRRLKNPNTARGVKRLPHSCGMFTAWLEAEGPNGCGLKNQERDRLVRPLH